MISWTRKNRCGCAVWKRAISALSHDEDQRGMQAAAKAGSIPHSQPQSGTQSSRESLVRRGLWCG